MSEGVLSTHAPHLHLHLHIHAKHTTPLPLRGINIELSPLPKWLLQPRLPRAPLSRVQSPPLHQTFRPSQALRKFIGMNSQHLVKSALEYNPSPRHRSPNPGALEFGPGVVLDGGRASPRGILGIKLKSIPSIRLTGDGI
jgi:hypothetical protein